MILLSSSLQPGRWTAKGTTVPSPIYLERKMIFKKPPWGHVPADNLQGCSEGEGCAFFVAFSGGWFLVCPGGGSCAPIAPGTGHSAVVGGCGECMLQWDEGRWQAWHWCDSWCFVFLNGFTHLKFNSSPLKSYLPNRKVVFQPPFFRVYVKLRGCVYLYIQLSAMDFLMDFFLRDSSICEGTPSYGCFFSLNWGIVESWTDNRNSIQVFFTVVTPPKKTFTSEAFYLR